MLWRLAGAVVAVAVAAGLYPSSPEAELTTSWLKLTVMGRAAPMLYMVCGMRGGEGAGTSIFGGPWRQCFEGVTMVTLGVATTGEWNGVVSEDVRFEAPALGRSPTRELIVRVYREGNGSYDPAHPEQRPVLLWLHGGGWAIEHTYSTDYDRTCRALAAEGGWVVASVEYRLAPEHPFPAAVHDAYAALSWLAAAAAPGSSRAQPLASADLERLVVGGDSAGGNLAAVLAVMARDKLDPEGQPAAVELPVRHQLLVYPATFPPGGATESRRRLRTTALFLGAGIQDFFLAAYLSSYFGSSPHVAGAGHPFDYSERPPWITDPRVSPFAAANGHTGLAPATVVLGEADPLRDEGRLYADALRAAAVPTHVLEYRMPHHFFILGHKLALPETAAAVREAAHAVNQGLRSTIP